MDLFAQAVEHHQAGRLQSAERIYRQLLRDEPRHVLALHALGLLCHQSGRSDAAVELIAQAIALHDQEPDFHYNLGRILQAQGKLEAAASSYTRALTLKEDYAEAHNNLGKILETQGKREPAMASYARAVTHQPGYTAAHYNLGCLLFEAGKPDAAAAHFKSCLESDPRDLLGARLLLARLGATAMPAQASAAQLERIYAKRASSWDREKYYRGHQLVAAALAKSAHGPKLDILDAGCGTGLVGTLIAPLANRLEGVDLSSAMLGKAREKNIYAELHQGELVSFMAARPDRYDAITCAATLIHFGDLTSVFAAGAAALKDDGVFVFTLFLKDGDDFAVAPDTNLARTGCFVHAPGYVARAAQAQGFAVEELQTDIHEHAFDESAPVTGLIVTLRRLPRL